MKNFLLTLTVIVGFSATPLFAQYKIEYPKWYPATGFQNLFVVCRDTSDAYAKTVFNIVRDNWKLTPVKTTSLPLNYMDKSLLVKGNLFLDFTTDETEFIFMRDNGKRVSGGSMNFFRLAILSLKDEYNPKKSVNENMVEVGSAELYNRTIGMGTLAMVARGDFTSPFFPRDFLNGMTGNIKNMIQYFNAELPKNQSKDLNDEAALPELANLQTDTLYVPNYWYGKGTMLDGLKEAASYHDKTVSYVDEFIKSYPYKIKLVTREELNDKILSAQKAVYYFNLVQSSSNKIVSVCNGLTGAVLYTEITKVSYRIKKGDLENIAKAVRRLSS